MLNGKKARLFLLITCIVLAILLLTHVVTYLVSGIIFAIALAAFGVLSNGFRRT